jgi:hypothetical protein
LLQDGKAAHQSLDDAHEATEAAGSITWEAQHGAHDIDNSAGMAHEAIVGAFNIVESDELNGMDNNTAALIPDR